MIKIKCYDASIDNLDKLKELVGASYQINKAFFGQEVEKIGIYFLYTRAEMNRIVGKDTPDWLVGYTKDYLIAIFSPTVFDKASSHSFFDFIPVLTHEIAHVFTNSIFGNYKNQYPVWFHEGIAGVVAKQYKKYDLKKIRISKFSEISSSKDWREKPNYPHAYLFTKYLFDKYGKEIMLSLVKQACEEISLEDFPQTFAEATKDNFDSICSDWERSIR